MTLKMYFINITTQAIPIRLLLMDGLTEPIFLGRLRLERLASYQMVGQQFSYIDGWFDKTTFLGQAHF